jgi:hypothetical protein
MSDPTDSERIAPGTQGFWFGEDDVWLLREVRALDGSDSGHVRRALALYLGVQDAAADRGADLAAWSDRDLRAWVRQLALDDLREE